MVRKLRVILPLLFVSAFAFALVVSMHATAVADGPCGYLAPRPGCCILAVHCNDKGPDSYWVCGYGIWNGVACIKDLQSGCPPPETCVPPP